LKTAPWRPIDPADVTRLLGEPEADSTAGGKNVVKKKHKMLGHRDIVPQSVDVEKGLRMRILGVSGAVFGVLLGTFT
jgi:hypothetical protein